MHNDIYVTENIQTVLISVGNWNSSSPSVHTCKVYENLGVLEKFVFLLATENKFVTR